jgi:RimJ/RimL family protein N-acetyltransferase
VTSAPARDVAGNPVGRPVPGWTARAMPGGTLVGRTVRVEPLAAHHVDGLHAALDVGSPDAIWAYYPDGPFSSVAALGAWLDGRTADAATVAHAVLTADGVPRGLACYLRTDRANGVVEIGNIVLSAALQRTTAATEAMYLMMRHVFDDLGYRRYEWKCDSLNAPSRRAAGRLGFSYEGTFRQAVVYRGRNRDTAWYAITDADWPAIRGELERWLDPANTDDDGVQRTRLDVATALGRVPERAPQDRGRGGMER